jgi:hypothetical protein
LMSPAVGLDRQPEMVSDAAPLRAC